MGPAGSPPISWCPFAIANSPLGLETIGESLVLFPDAGRQMIAKLIEVFALALEVILPTLAIHGNQPVEIGLGDIKFPTIQALRLRHIADGRLFRLSTTLGTLDDPA